MKLSGLRLHPIVDDDFKIIAAVVWYVLLIDQCLGGLFPQGAHEYRLFWSISPLYAVMEHLIRPVMEGSPPITRGLYVGRFGAHFELCILENAPPPPPRYGMEVLFRNCRSTLRTCSLCGAVKRRLVLTQGHYV